MTIADNKRFILLKLLRNMEDTLTNVPLKTSVSHLYDTVSHTAPEILDSRWSKIYNLCVMYINDDDNAEHAKCFKLYEQAFEDYKRLL